MTNAQDQLQIQKYPGKLFVFEGADGVGKSYLASVLTSRLRELGVPALQLSFPGRRDHSLGNLVYKLHHQPETLDVIGIAPLALQALHIAAHFDEISNVILPKLSSGTWIVLDRYWWSTWVYGLSTGGDREALEFLIAAEKRVWGTVRPDALFVVDREHAIRDELSQEKFQMVQCLYSEIRRREHEVQPTFVLNNDDLEQCRLQLIGMLPTVTAYGDGG